MALFNSSTAAEAGRRSKRTSAKKLIIDSTLDEEELTQNALSGDYGAVTQRQVLLMLIQHHLRHKDRLLKQAIDEEDLVSAAYLKTLARHELEAIMESHNA
ncbi:TPA: hypothetical protein NG675_003492 [Vibrio parahaemolyticus]|uniref:hypothetical protein n=1 Tax=Vibrio parahaemolyticus TaxID=670 RepID=UPI0005B7097F|nr:hypothetical protein [Vibrio parahaemolyticus]KIT48955.1 hypothetical protein H334_08740 [Vibrio parahaemolyticus 901128]EGR3116256.1 hypothetical protein [Vibrio parahaemolyticus]EGR3179086.1 hypothetical protein [Vibrio parahaemolyticus]EHH3659213.1 hypothetical protein [Vibrio parahaemolyticus]EHR6436403.1 hypothetical protein [Vibrio parahaemolyticus]